MKSTKRTEKTERWDMIKEKFRRLYIVEGKTLEGAIQEIERIYSVKASLRTWKTKVKGWGFSKNLSHEAMAVLTAKAEKRKRDEGKDTIFYYHDRMIEVNKLKNFKRRKATNSKELDLEVAGTPPHIKYSTPKATASIGNWSQSQDSVSSKEHERQLTRLGGIEMEENVRALVLYRGDLRRGRQNQYYDMWIPNNGRCSKSPANEDPWIYKAVAPRKLLADVAQFGGLGAQDQWIWDFLELFPICSGVGPALLDIDLHPDIAKSGPCLASAVKNLSEDFVQAGRDWTHRWGIYAAAVAICLLYPAYEEALLKKHIYSLLDLQEKYAIFPGPLLDTLATYRTFVKLFTKLFGPSSDITVRMMFILACVAGTIPLTDKERKESWLETLPSRKELDGIEINDIGLGTALRQDAHNSSYLKSILCLSVSRLKRSLEPNFSTYLSLGSPYSTFSSETLGMVEWILKRRHTVENDNVLALVFRPISVSSSHRQHAASSQSSLTKEDPHMRSLPHLFQNMQLPDERILDWLSLAFSPPILPIDIYPQQDLLDASALRPQLSQRQNAVSIIQTGDHHSNDIGDVGIEMASLGLADSPEQPTPSLRELDNAKLSNTGSISTNIKSTKYGHTFSESAMSGISLDYTGLFESMQQ